MQRYPRAIKAKSFVLPHCFEETFINRKIVPSADKIVIRYMGNFYGARNPVNFLRAVSEIEKETPEILKKVRIEFYGKWINSGCLLGDFSVLIDKYVFFYEPVTYFESIDLMAKANILLIIDAPFDMSVFLPSKLIDYMSVYRPILGITPKGTSAEAIKKYGGIIASPHNIGAIKLGLTDALRAYKNGSFKEVDRQFVNSFEANIIGKTYKKCFQEIM